MLLESAKKKGFVFQYEAMSTAKNSHPRLILSRMMWKNSTSGMYFGRKSQTPWPSLSHPFFGISPPTNQPTVPFSSPKLRQLYVGCTKKLTVKRKVVDTSESAPRSDRWCSDSWHWNQFFARFFSAIFFRVRFNHPRWWLPFKDFFWNFHPYWILGEMIQSEDVFFETGTFFFTLPTSKKKKFRRILEWQDSNMVVLALQAVALFHGANVSLRLTGGWLSFREQFLLIYIH